MQLANAVGSMAVLVLTSEFSQDALGALGKKEIHIEFVASDFSEAADWIIRDAPQRMGNSRSQQGPRTKNDSY